MKVLIVEDELQLAEQLSLALGEAGYAVDHAADGERGEFLGAPGIELRTNLTGVREGRESRLGGQYPSEDFEEMLGNLVDNSCKWAKAHVEVRSTVDNGRVVLTVDDDGPGLDPALREMVLRRGVRADEAAPGSGLGLAIVADLVELYGGSIALGSSSFGGLRATLRLPLA